MKQSYHGLILRTKLYKPLVKDHYVLRQSIIDQLENNRHNPLTLVVAATGYGKSVTVSQWLDQTKTKYCWVSLDDELNDVQYFLLYLVHAIRTALPGALSVLHDLLLGPEMPPEKVLIKLLISGLDETNQEVILVMDDYQTIHNNQIHEIINTLLKFHLTTLHLVIISRLDPALNLSALRVYGNINELRMSDLRFTEKEITALTGKILNTPISGKIAAILLQKTEGWIVGLRLALMKIAQNPDIDNSIEQFKIDQAYFSQFLVEEVLQQQPEPVRKLLLTASIPDQFSRELLAALMQGESGNTIFPDTDLFDQLIRMVLFIIPLDEEGQWYRFHHLFRDFLLKQLEKSHSKEQIENYHKKASIFFSQNHLIEKAIAHAVKAGDTNQISQLFKHHKYQLLNTDQFSRLRKMVHLVPAAIVEQEPQLLLIRAFLHETTADYSSMQQDLMRAESLLSVMSNNDGQLNRLWGEFHAIYSGQSYFTGNIESTLDHSEKASKLLSDLSYIRDFALVFRCLALQTSGQAKKAFHLIKRSLKGLSPQQDVERMRLHIISSLLYAFDGNLTEIMKAAMQYKPISLEKRLYVSLSYAVYFIAATYYFRNELEKVEQIVDQIQEYRYAGRPFTVLNCLFLKAFVMQAEGNSEALAKVLREMHAFAADYDNDKYQQFVYVFEVELALRQKNVPQAREISKKTNFELYPPVFYFFFPRLTYIRLLMSTDEPDSITEATTRLEQLIHLGRSTHRKNLLIQALPLQALFYLNSGDEKSAMETLSEALILAKPGGHIRNFVDLGEPMQAMIKKLYQNKPNDVYLAKLFNAFHRKQADSDKIAHEESDIVQSSPESARQKITKREARLLQLVAEGYQNKEIAEELYLATDTIKKSLYHLYKKLDVNNRTGAISKAVKMGLIKSSS